MTLDLLPLGQEAVITAVGGGGALRCRLLDMGLIPRTAVRVEKTAPLGDPIELRVRGYALSLRKEDARNIQVEVAQS
ncbi:FeoA family protein [Oscillibacter sp.]|jgi:ferrous iron transport protein A|uniref:FeoA family protein n=1 Tax=Oscillibacter sp. TaxID=1945593 RepID=UPI00216F8903|nr:FeoA family protein [Oscillibacter sp.]MCI9648810.1 ferrous iron transport protein A [Oscillibacter sp.]